MIVELWHLLMFSIQEIKNCQAFAQYCNLQHLPSSHILDRLNHSLYVIDLVSAWISDCPFLIILTHAILTVFWN